MFKVIILLLFIFEIETFNAKLILFREGQPFLPEPQCIGKDKDEVHLKYAPMPYNGYDFPPDDGGNFGDLICDKREPNDTLIARELVINEEIYNIDMGLIYMDEFDGWNITTVRAVNVGRQRAYTWRVVYNEFGMVFVEATVKRGEQMRLWVEVYALPVKK